MGDTPAIYFARVAAEETVWWMDFSRPWWDGFSLTQPCRPPGILDDAPPPDKVLVGGRPNLQPRGTYENPHGLPDRKPPPPSPTIFTLGLPT